MDTAAKKKQFHDAMLEICRQTPLQCIGLNGKPYNPVRFRQMVQTLGGWQTAKELIKTNELSDGFVELVYGKCLHLSMEAIMLEQDWGELFTAEELDIAAKRLRAAGYDSGT